MLVVSSLRRISAAVSLSAAALVLAGCTGPVDVPTMPAASDAQFAIRARANDGTQIQSIGGDTTLALVRIDPSSTDSYDLGRGHILWVRANGVCALHSPYGPAFWDEPCELRREPLILTVKSWRDAGGHPQIEFSPDVRFAPAEGPRGTAMLYLRAGPATLAAAPTILYCRDGVCVDESIADPALATIVDPKQGYVYRRVKHLSGFVIAGGFADDFPY